MTALTPEQRVEKARAILEETQDFVTQAVGAADTLLALAERMPQDEMIGRAVGHIAQQIHDLALTNADTQDRL